MRPRLCHKTLVRNHVGIFVDAFCCYTHCAVPPFTG
jgi:hypothetical protein